MGREYGIYLVHGIYFVYIFFFFFRGKVYEPFLREITPDDGRYTRPSYEHSELYIKGDDFLNELVNEQLKLHGMKQRSKWQRLLQWVR
jgi:hypothetical protein